MSRATTLASWVVPMLVMGLIGAGVGPVFAEPYQVIDVTNGGTITEVAVWKGEVPELLPIKIGSDQDIAARRRRLRRYGSIRKTMAYRMFLSILNRLRRGRPRRTNTGSIWRTANSRSTFFHLSGAKPWPWSTTIRFSTTHIFSTQRMPHS